MFKHPALLSALAALLLLGLFSPEIRDPDFWWHLKTGQYLVERHSLPSPDPFAYTTASAHDAYAGEAITRHFNLTHEWLAQAMFYGVYRAAGFPGIVLFRALLLTVFCGIAGWIVFLRTHWLYRAIATSLLAAAVAVRFALDRPFLFTFLFLALTLLVLETRRHLWLLPAILLVWANCHGGFFLGWIALAIYTLRNRRLWPYAAGAVLISGLNPNGFHVLEVLTAYRGSGMQSKLLEWAPPRLWPPSVFSLLLAGAVAVLMWARRRVTVTDWLLLAAFAAAALAAERNTVLIGFLAPILIASYMPKVAVRHSAVPYALAAALVLAILVGTLRGSFFQLRAAEWRYPSGAADFIREHRLPGRLFNTYEYGGFLMWKLWPEQQVFIDGRALSESLFEDYGRILYNYQGGAQALLDRYNVDILVLNAFEYNNGPIYFLAPLLADPRQTTWTLVYSDPQAMVFARRPPAGMAVLDPSLVLTHLEEECGLHIDREPGRPRCARSLAQTFAKLGDFSRARRWLGIYLEHWKRPDPEAEAAYQQYLGMGR